MVLVIKDLLVNVGDIRDPWAGNIPWKKAWQPTSVFLPGESHGQKSLVGYSPWVAEFHFIVLTPVWEIYLKPIILSFSWKGGYCGINFTEFF